jgi:anti-sigma factor (TIGR02949 family)
MVKKKKMKNVDGPCEDHEKCIHIINLIMDGEANREEETFFYTHIQDCLHCAQYYKLEQSIRDIIKRKLKIREAPEGLIRDVRQKVKDSIDKST